MSGIFILFLILGAASTILYASGYIMGMKQAFSDRDADTEVSDYKDSAYTASIACAVVAAAVIIGLVGQSPIFVYAGPLLAIITTFMVGFAFFYEKMMRESGNY